MQVKSQWIDIGGRRIGFRWSESRLDHDVRTVLRHELTDGDAPPNISVVVGGNSGGVRDKRQLYVQGRLVLVSGSDARVVRAIVRAISDLTSAQPEGSLLVRTAIVITADGEAILVDRRLGQDLWNLDRRLRRHGCRVIDSATVAIDVESGSAVLTNPAELLAEGARAELSNSPDAAWLDDFRDGSIPISRLVVMGAATGDSLAEVLAEAAPITLRPNYAMRVDDVERLLEVLRRVQSRAVAPDEPGALLAALGLGPR